jgi:hypothetical protein
LKNLELTLRLGADLLLNLDDSASPVLDELSKKMSVATSLKTSDRKSLLKFLGMPIGLFGKVSHLTRRVDEDP